MFLMFYFFLKVGCNNEWIFFPLLEVLGPSSSNICFFKQWKFPHIVLMNKFFAWLNIFRCRVSVVARLLLYNIALYIYFQSNYMICACFSFVRLKKWRSISSSMTKLLFKQPCILRSVSSFSIFFETRPSLELGLNCLKLWFYFCYCVVKVIYCSSFVLKIVGILNWSRKSPNLGPYTWMT